MRRLKDLEVKKIGLESKSEDSRLVRLGLELENK